jgi:hypothetical protein
MDSKIGRIHWESQEKYHFDYKPSWKVDYKEESGDSQI